MYPEQRPISPIRGHLEQALAKADNPDQKRHLREALQLLEGLAHSES